jgi:hypothetical protein
VPWQLDAQVVQQEFRVGRPGRNGRRKIRARRGRLNSVSRPSEPVGSQLAQIEPSEHRTAAGRDDEDQSREQRLAYADTQLSNARPARATLSVVFFPASTHLGPLTASRQQVAGCDAVRAKTKHE